MRRLSSRTAGQNVIASTDPETHRAIVTRTQRTTLWGMIHSTWRRGEDGESSSQTFTKLRLALPPLSSWPRWLSGGSAQHSYQHAHLCCPNPGLQAQPKPLPSQHLCVLQLKLERNLRGHGSVRLERTRSCGTLRSFPPQLHRSVYSWARYLLPWGCR